MWRCLVVIIFVSSAFAQTQEDEDQLTTRDTAVGLPPKYARTYLIAADTISPDGKYAMIFPTVAAEGQPDLLVALKPFRVLGALDAKDPYFQHQSNGGIAAIWNKDSSVAVVTLDGRWGPHDIFLHELRDGKLSRSTDLLGKIKELLLPDFREAKPEPYNETFDFILDTEDTAVCRFDDAGNVQIKATATTDPKHIGGIKAWDARLEAIWDIAQAKFTSQKVTRLFAGVRKG